MMPNVDLISAQSAEDGLIQAEEARPDLILMDINLPTMDGKEACRRLKAHEVTAHIPVIAVSGAGMGDDIVQIEAIGFSAYLMKPFRINEVVNAINEALKGVEKGEEKQRTY